MFGDDLGPTQEFFACSAESFDLVSFEDEGFPVCTPDPFLSGTASTGQGLIISNIGGNGAWGFQTASGQSSEIIRAVGLNFSSTLTGADCTGLTSVSVGGELGGDTCSCGTLCFVQVRMIADRVFKKKATRQQFSISVLGDLGGGESLGPPRLNINYVNPLYICLDTDKDVRFLQTDPCPGSSLPSVAEAEVDHPLPPNFTSFDPLGRWNMPVKIRLRRVPLPGGDDGGGGCVGSGTLPKGDVCMSDDDCCSGKCKGGGTKTCK